MMFASLAILAVSLITIPLAGAFASGWSRLPALEMAGLALGRVVAHGLGAILAVGYLLSGRTGLTLRVGHPSLSIFSDIMQVGVVASVNSALTVLTVVLMVGAVGQHGEAALAGYGLGARLELLMIPIVFGIGAAMTEMVGANIGAGRKERALAIAWTGSLAAAGIVGTIGLIVAPFCGFFAIGLALYFANRMLWPFLGGVLRICVAFGGAMFLSATTDLGVTSVFIAIAAGPPAPPHGRFRPSRGLHPTLAPAA